MSQFRDEIAEQPQVASRLLLESRAAVAAIGNRVRAVAPRGFVIAARGSSDNAALFAKYLLGARNHFLVSLAAPSLFTQYGRPPDVEDQCVVGISQSGATEDVIAVVEVARRQGALTIAITNDPESQLARAAELVLPLGAGPERSIPSSKTYTASLLALALVSQAISPDPTFESALFGVPDALARALTKDSELQAIVQPLMGPRAIVLGRGYNFSTAEEIALKLTETSYVLARAWSVADFEHGPIALIEGGFPVLVVNGGGPVAADLESLRERLDEKACQVIQLIDGVSAHVDEPLTVALDSQLPEELTPITIVVLGQLLAYYVAIARGIDPDRPRTLKKVTRTW